jgi:hypothetical protein
MNDKFPFRQKGVCEIYMEEIVGGKKEQIGNAGRWAIFSGAPMVLYALQACTYERLVHVVGERLGPYIGLGIGGIIIVLSLIVYDHVPRRLVFPIGIVGWIVTLSLMYWYSMSAFDPRSQ